MLVLSRKPGEKIHIGSDIVVTVLEVTGRLVRIGIDAPKNIGILRAEIREQISEENKRAALGFGYLHHLKNFQSFIRFKRK